MNTDATRAHIDAETLAAWADHGLPAEAAAAVELHLSNCDRCQEVLAAFVRSAPAAGAVVIPFWARRPVQWSAAGLAAAAAIVAMIWIGRPPAAPTPESTVAAGQLQPIPVPPPSSQPSSIAPSAPAEPKREKQSSLADRQERRQDKPTGSLDDKTAANEALKKVEGRAAVAAEPSPVPRPVAAAPPPPPSAATKAPPVTVGGVAGGVVTQAGAAKPTITLPPAMSETVAMDAFSPVAPSFEIAPPDPGQSAFRNVAGGAGRGGAGAANVVSQTRVATRWRVVAGTRLERTVDAGATWAALPIEPELKTPLVAGVATSQSNCWLVGRDGVVLVTSDGTTFRRVSVPEAVHLTAVIAQDSMHATVTTIDGRRFSTTDGGLTWK